MPLNREQERRSIIDNLKKLESVFGRAAKLANRSSEDEEDSIRECYEQCYAGAFRKHIGKELFNDLVKYNVQYNNKQKINFTE